MEKTEDHSKLYLMVFLALGALTACTVGLSYLKLPLAVGISLAALISVIKCTLIGAIFMHLKWEKGWIYALIVCGLLLVAFLVFWLMRDVGNLGAA